MRGCWNRAVACAHAAGAGGVRSCCGDVCTAESISERELLRDVDERGVVGALPIGDAAASDVRGRGVPEPVDFDSTKGNEDARRSVGLPAASPPPRGDAGTSNEPRSALTRGDCGAGVRGLVAPVAGAAMISRRVCFRGRKVDSDGLALPSDREDGGELPSD